LYVFLLFNFFHLTHFKMISKNSISSTCF
jgi:hypothetical protein